MVSVAVGPVTTVEAVAMGPVGVVSIAVGPVPVEVASVAVGSA